MTPVLEEMVGVCGVCGEVASNHDLQWITDRDDLTVGDLICCDCAAVRS